MKRSCWALGMTIVFASCGGDRAERPPPAPPPQTTTPAGYPIGGEPRPTQPGMAPPPATATAEAPTVLPGESEVRKAMALRAAELEYSQAARELELSMRDCATACRALGSLERAAGHICELASAARCEDAKVRVRQAREQIKATCGGCPGGPSVDKDAPIPSR